MSEILPYFPFYYRDFIHGTLEFTTEEKGAYVLLLCYQWDKGFIPDDEPTLRKITGVSAKKLKKVLKKFQNFSDGKKNKKLNQIRIDKLSYIEKQRQKALSDWKKKKEGVGSHMGSHMGSPSEAIWLEGGSQNQNHIHSNSNNLAREEEKSDVKLQKESEPTPEEKSKTYHEKIKIDDGFREAVRMRRHVESDELFFRLLEEFFIRKNNSGEMEKWKTERQCRQHFENWIPTVIDDFRKPQNEKNGKHQSTQQPAAKTAEKKYGSLPESEIKRWLGTGDAPAD